MAEILLADDNAAFRDGMALTLELEGYAVRTAADGEEALVAFRARRPDLVLLDVVMPRKNGYAVCAEIRIADPDVPVLFLTEKGSETDVLRGFGTGADDYMAKTAPESEKLARIAAALRRCRRSLPAAGAGLRFGEWEVDTRGNALVSNGRRVELTVREVELLRCFAAAPGEIFSRDHLLTRFWGAEFSGDEHSLTVALSRLREKLGASGCLIRTMRGQGYAYFPS